METAAWDHPAMRLIADAATPVTRMVLINELETDDGYAFELHSPLFLAAGDRISFQDGNLVVARSSGERLRPVGSWSTRCHTGYRHPTAAS
ncbi:hypothetical protein ASD48_40325 [Streptomyces sp. Root1310]|nr:hypothetical protein ASD48_40325 [Streptomyces sp. Root1310]